jgi:uncharacterized protein YndB with AHSA1/START domain
MDERGACSVLKRSFEARGLAIEENRPFDEDGVAFEIDGFDPERRIGYEYVTEEAGDSWDVDERVVAALDERRRKGELFVLILHETDAPDEAAIEARATAFLDEVMPPKAKKSAAKKPATKKPAAKKPAAKKPAARKKK